MERAINTFFYVAILIALAGVVLGAIYGAVVGTFVFVLGGGTFGGMLFGGYFGAIGGVPLSIVVGIAVAIAQSRYERPYTAEQARFIGRVGDVIALIMCIAGVVFLAGSSGDIIFFGIPAIITFLACHWIILHYLRKHTVASKPKAKNIA